MCVPLAVGAAVVSGVLGVAQTTASIVSQSRAAKAQQKAINSQLQVVEEENRQVASAELFDDMRAARREQASIRTAAGQAGLGLASGSVEALLMDSAMQAEMRQDRSRANMESRSRANHAEATSMMSRVQKPTVLGAGLQIGASAASAWSGIQNAKIATRGPAASG